MTKTHVIDGVTYVEANRKAEIGEKVIITDNTSNGFKEGYIGTVSALIFGEQAIEIDDTYGHYHEDYRVLEPLQTVEPPAVDVENLSPSAIELLANLARRVTSLESQLAATQRNLETTAEELANTRHRLAKHADRFAAVEDKVEMLTDDIVTLDDRSQVLNAINKYYAEGSR